MLILGSEIRGGGGSKLKIDLKIEIFVVMVLANLTRRIALAALR